MKPQDYSRRNRYRPPAPWYRAISNRLGVLLTSLGLAPKDAVTLGVRGRRTGNVRRTPVRRTSFGGDDYLVALAGESEWVGNVRAAGGRAVIRRRGARPVHLVELSVEERPPIIREYLRRVTAKAARSYFGLRPDPSPNDPGRGRLLPGVPGRLRRGRPGLTPTEAEEGVDNWDEGDRRGRGERELSARLDLLGARRRGPKGDQRVRPRLA